MEQALIDCRGVTFGYEGIPEPALRGVSLAIKAGEWVAVLGQNGSGKSTLARLMNALLMPSSGSVRVDDLDTRRPESLWAIRRTVSMVFQNPDNQIVATTAEEDVAFGPENLGLPTAEIARRVGEALQLVGLSELRHRPPHQLSGGQKQRLAIAGALAMRPKCLVLDEPTSMLDPAGREQVMDLLDRLHRQEGLAVVLITHEMAEAVRADRIIVLNQGSVCMEGTPSEIFQRGDELQRVGLDLPDVVVLAERLRRAGVPVPRSVLTLEHMVEFLCR